MVAGVQVRIGSCGGSTAWKGPKKQCGPGLAAVSSAFKQPGCRCWQSLATRPGSAQRLGVGQAWRRYPGLTVKVGGSICNHQNTL